ncbi:MAG TPA: amino acid permease [Candidatus Saccharimonadales bacterium]|nr:amino acid permease [Candidatus Saccharimonadales bacterium]
MFDFKKLLLGRPRDIWDPKIFHRISLIAVLAWVGLGADGLSSSSYGPEAAFRALGSHHYLSVYLALVMAATVFIISYAYSRIIEVFPSGGGGYVVATKLLGERAGLTSGSALLVDYTLTITTSIASSVDALWSLLPPHYQPLKLPVDFVVLAFLVLLNLRGVKESVTVLAPIFFVFLAAHAVLLGGAVLQGAGHLGQLHREVVEGTRHDLRALGTLALLMLFFRAYSLGGGTYTGLEAVSNGLPVMREPKVETGKTTMFYMAVSLALTAGGILLCYQLLNVRPVEGQTMNAVLTERFVQGWPLIPAALGHLFLIVVLVSEAMLLFVGAQAGFIDGPRVMANMAVDSWFPHRFSALSERLSMQNGVLLMGAAAAATLLYTRGRVEMLVVMYSINVFLTFSLSQLGMIRYWLQARRRREHWKRHVPIHVVGFFLCVGILCVTTIEKFAEGGWVTLACTAVLVGVCTLVRRHYRRVNRHTRELDEILQNIPLHAVSEPPPLRPDAPTAVLLVSGYNGLGIHSLLSLLRLFPKHFANVVFVSVGVLDSATFKGAEETEALREKTEGDLQKYVELANRLGLAASVKVALDTEVLDEAERLCKEARREFPQAIVFTSKLIFQKENILQRLLHNETAYALQRRLQFSGLQTVVLPVRVTA